MWFQRLGFKENPFNVRPTSRIVGYEKERETLLNYVLSGDLVFIKGRMGIGKTSMLLWLIDQLKRKNFKKVIRIPTHLKTKKEITKFFRKNNTFFMRILGKKIPDGHIVIVDEVQDISKDTVEYLRSLWDEGKIFSLILSGTSLNASEFTLDRCKIIELRPMSFDEIYLLLKSRIGERNIFTLECIKYVAEKSEYVPRKFLHLCETLAMNAQSFPINKEFAEMILGKVTKGEEIPLEGTVQEKILKLLKIKGPLTAKDISKILGISLQSTWKHISILYKQGFIEKIRGKPVKYKLKK